MFVDIRAEFEELYDSQMTIKRRESAVINGITKQRWTTVAKDEPCRISQKQLNPTVESVEANMTYVTTLYCSPDLEVLPGSQIIVTDPHGTTREYEKSSEGFSSYHTHQEIVISRSETA